MVHVRDSGSLDRGGGSRDGESSEFKFWTDLVVLAWRILGTGEPGGLLSMGSQSRTRLK